jgi:hypothetical protein
MRTKLVLGVAMLAMFAVLMLGDSKLIRGADAPAEKPKIEQFGDPIIKTVSICQILVNPKDFEDQDVVIEGLISWECGMGCRFQLESLEKKGKTINGSVGDNIEKIPQRKGYLARVLGKVQLNDKEEPVITATGMEIWPAPEKKR